jgi:hypothetical protein
MSDPIADLIETDYTAKAFPVEFEKDLNNSLPTGIIDVNL